MNETGKNAETRRTQIMEISGPSLLIKPIISLSKKKHTYKTTHTVLYLILDPIGIGTLHKCLGQQSPNTGSGLDADPEFRDKS